MIELLAVFGGLVLLILLMRFASKNSHALDKKYYSNHWTKIEETFGLGDSGMRIAVIDADKLVDHALKQTNVPGKTMGERMKRANYLKSINNLWTAHKLRNKLVHEPDTVPKKSEMRSALGTYKKTLKEMGAL